MTLHICILETDVIRPELIDEFKGYGHMFEQLFAKQPIAAEFSVFNVLNGQYPPQGGQYDAYLVTGSKADSFSQEPWVLKLKDFLLERYQRGDTLLGVCFGHQLLALTLGGEVARAEQGWGVGTHEYQLESPAQWQQPSLDKLTLLISHQDQVTRLPEHAQRLAFSSFCPNAAYYIGNQVLCFQGHPEFVPGYSKALLELRAGAMGDAQLCQKGIASLSREHQGVTIAEWMMRFVAANKQAQAA